MKKTLMGLNPYSTGSNSNHSCIIWYVFCCCLNPYSTGSNSNTNKKLWKKMTSFVLILILLEVTQILFGWQNDCDSLVLILYLLEVTQIDIEDYQKVIGKYVLILILLEVTQISNTDIIRIWWPLSCLNPYSTGSNSNSYREYRIKQGLES